MRFTESSLLFALSAVTIVSGEKTYQKLASQGSPFPATSNVKTLYKGLTSNNQLMARQGSAGGSNYCSGVGATCRSNQ
ncbi:hypothetical protein N7499_005306 [Penicillium canescens]|nr:hypothetical protein N7522_004288 [Penicillium canescens]KAJ6085677.1 hypothetical protein N7499_005306 [Penicillium canescens]KAJ6162450.1 hypothetical protein N7485_010680 [Penicillium canescens]